MYLMIINILDKSRNIGWFLPSSDWISFLVFIKDERYILQRIICSQVRFILLIKYRTLEQTHTRKILRNVQKTRGFLFNSFMK